jgi:branched-chain amino acid transport system ATP-binding protein
MTILEVEGLSKRFGGVVASDSVTLEVAAGEIHAVIGPNGAGKTTLIAQLAGELRPDAGTIRFEGRDVTALDPPARAGLGMGRSFQITSVFAALSVAENAALAVQAHDGHAFRFWRKAAADAALMGAASALLERVGLADRADAPTSALSHGEQRQLEIAMALAGKPRLLLLDEPTAGMASADSQRMVEFLARLKGQTAMLLVEHDMDAVFALADRITVLTYGRVIATGTPDTIRGDAAVRAAYLGTDDDA